MTQGPRVLVIEDDGVTLRIVVKILQLSGFRVLPATNALQGVHAAREERPDVILMDLGLPDVGGMLAAASITEDPALKDIPVILVSGMPDLRSKASETGAVDILCKPFTPGELVRRVRRWARRPVRKELGLPESQP